MAHIAYFSLILAFVCAISTVITASIGLKQQRGQWLQSSSNGLRAIAGLLTFAVLLLLYFLFQRNFQIEYVASHTNLKLPTIYIISALWAGQQGSLLFWAWALALCYVVFIRYYRSTIFSELAYIYLVAGGTLGFFLLVLLFAANPFRELAFFPPDGNGLNPLLQNLYMAIHPPILLIGYAGFGVPFALAFAVLGCGKLSDEWVKYVRGWTFFSWYFLGIGILLGAHWAYLELGWGGYWSWDPVENSSLIPWLASTALLHTLMLQQRRDVLKIWNIFISILMFALCILAAFITRSGVIRSVHAFGKSTIGAYFLAFLVVSVLCGGGLIVYRRKALRTPYIQTALLSKEGSLLLTNQLFMGFGFAIFYGTLYPLFSELVTGRKVVINPSFFNAIAIPVGVILLGVIALCQLLGWGKMLALPMLKKGARPLSLTLIGIVFMFLSGIRHPVVLLTCGFGSMIILTRPIMAGTMLFAHRKTVGSLIIQKQRSAAYLVHVGVALICMGIAISSAYQQQHNVELRPTESAMFGDFRFQYDRLYFHNDSDVHSVAAEISVYHHDRKIATVLPEKRIYTQSQDAQVATEIGLYTSLTRDIYVILSGWKNDQTAMLTIMIHPYILWIWIGGFLVFTLAMIVAILPGSWGNSLNTEMTPFDE